ncbi:hypothetical protein TrVE_jg7740 [Triparma verrucosa]|uniref:Cyclic nucleotide-binding domain-containing protein n=1 Tax=Triparma verrucosa TaxID=1606542 RepID=A0A9W7B120_9STRA|nr:hypothetical protein TrVE_jg7740 [Triparma verrucosa]
MADFVSEVVRNLASSSSSASTADDSLTYCNVTTHNCTCALDEDAHAEHGHAEIVILFPFLVLATGAASEALVHHTPFPYTTFLLMIGAIVGWLMKADLLGPLGESGKNMADMDAHLLLYTFLPPLIFESAYNVDETHFTKVASAAITYAVPGLLVSTCVTGGVISLLYPNWQWFEAGLLGALLSATDPVAVVALLKQVGTGSLLDTLIEAESLLNDGSAMVVFTVLFEAVKVGHMVSTVPEVLLKFVQMAIGGPIFGVIMGYVFSAWIGSIFNSSDVEVTLTLCAAYLTFFIGEYFLGLSGVLAVVACGIYMGNRGDTQVSPEVEHFLHEFWELLGYIANTCIFTLTGVIITYNDMWNNIEMSDFLVAIAIYFTAMGGRFCIFTGINWCFTKLDMYVPTKQETIICCWGALRGAVGLALGLVVWDNKEANGGLINDVYADKVLFHAAMIVIATLMGNATTVAKVLVFLGLDKVDELKDKLFRVSMDEIATAGTREIESLKLDELISCASWPDVRKLGQLVHKAKRVDKDAPETGVRLHKKKKSMNGRLENDNDDERSYRKHLTEIRELRESRRRCLAAVKASYRNQFRHGLLSRKALHFLENLTEKMIDTDCELEEWSEIAEHHLFSRVKKHGNTWVKQMLRAWDFQQLQFGYDVVCGFYCARQDALHNMEIILGSESAAFEHIKKLVEQDCFIAKKTIHDVQRYLPEIAANIATLRATRSMLNAQRGAASQLFEEGFLDKLEHGRVRDIIEHKMMKLQSNPPVIDLPSKLELIKEISWLGNATAETIQEMSRIAQDVVVDKGDVIIKQGETGENLFLIARGTATVTIHQDDKKEEEVVAEIGVGQLIGELSWLTHKPRAATVKAASKGLVYAFNGQKMMSIMDREGTFDKEAKRQQSLRIIKEEGNEDNGGGTGARASTLSPPGARASTLSPPKPSSPKQSTAKKKGKGETVRRRLWANAGSRMGENLLRYKEPYMTWDRSEVRRWLLQWVLYVPGENVKELVIIRPCILLDGEAAQPWQELTGESYEAPYYLKPQDGKPMTLKLYEDVKIFCPPGAIRDTTKAGDKKKDKDGKEEETDKTVFAAGGWSLIKQKMVDEKKGGWGKLAIDLKGAVQKEREVRKAQVKERRQSTSFISDNIHDSLLKNAENNKGGDSSPHMERTSFSKNNTERSMGSFRGSNSARIKPVGGGEKKVRSASSGLTLSDSVETQTKVLTRAGTNRRVMKELSFRAKSDSVKGEEGEGPSLDALVTKDSGGVMSTSKANSPRMEQKTSGNGAQTSLPFMLKAKGRLKQLAMSTRKMNN